MDNEWFKVLEKIYWEAVKHRDFEHLYLIKDDEFKDFIKYEWLEGMGYIQIQNVDGKKYAKITRDGRIKVENYYMIMSYKAT
ncbi:hypothetical protein [Tuberibacillus calidus]|uniref:hypothetical protein n=1 Tax=Tuberibacillus calidus TaxID=340097 RepID=UPI0004049026|nr:hypothetical protein [Tuberibacillus calidus]